MAGEKRTNNNGMVFSDNVTDTSSSALYRVGTYREENAKGYRYVQFDNGSGDVASADGALAYQYTTASDSHLVTSDYSDGALALNGVVGVFLGVVTDQYYCWIQTKGYHATVKTNGDDDIAAGDAIIASTSDGLCNSTAANTAPTNKVAGWATTADVDANNTVAVMLCID